MEMHRRQGFTDAILIGVITLRTAISTDEWKVEVNDKPGLGKRYPEENICSLF
jgi:hypothetical protein